MEQETKWRIILAAAGICVLCIMGGLIYGCSREKKEEPKVMDYQQTTNPAAVQKKLDVTQGAAREITREIYHVQQSDAYILAQGSSLPAGGWLTLFALVIIVCALATARVLYTAVSVGAV